MLSTIALLFAMTAFAPDTSDALPYYPDGVQKTTVDGRSIAYVDSGGDGPVLLFVHGLGSNLSLWRHSLDAFSDTHRVVALDLPGFGLSGKQDVPATMPFFAETVTGFLDALDIGRVTYVGASMGGQVGLTLALRHPEQLERLVLVSPAGIETFSAQDATALTSVTTPQSIASATAEQVRQNTRVNFATWRDTYAWLIEQRKALTQRDDFMAYATANAKAVAGMLNGAVRDHLDAVQTPTLVLFGAGDKLIPNRYLHPNRTTADVAQTADDALPNAEVHLVEDAGHLLMLEQTTVFHEKLRAFLNE